MRTVRNSYAAEFDDILAVSLQYKSVTDGRRDRHPAITALRIASNRYSYACVLLLKLRVCLAFMGGGGVCFTTLL